MAGFTVELAPVSGLALATWADPATETSPTRLNSPRHPPRYWRLSTVPQNVSFRALVGGVGMNDVDLGGSYAWGWSRYGNGPVPGFSWTAPNSWNPSVLFTARNTGLWIARAFFHKAGGVLLGLNVEPS